jgi:hypothetical protein
MSFLDHLDACNRHDLAHFRPFVAAGQRVGWIKRGFAGHLAAFPEVFAVDDDEVRLSERLASFEERTAAIRRVMDALAAQGEAPKRKGEDYPAAPAFGKPALFLIDRAVVSWFGIRAYGVHMNGFVRGSDGLRLWIGKRAQDKSVAPGKFDNIVAGGQPAGLGLMENLRKEAREEADLPGWVTDRARTVGAISYCLETEHGLKPDTMFIYDLDVPAGVVPRNTDGEMEGFQLMKVEEVIERVRTTDDFKFNVNLVLIDFFIRHGFLNPESDPDYMDLLRRLRAPLP